MCDTDKKALSISFVNYKANSQLELNKLQSRYETLNSTMLGLRNLFNDVNNKAQNCENDKNGFANEIRRLKDQLQQSDANSKECLNALESKSSDNKALPSNISSILTADKASIIKKWWLFWPPSQQAYTFGTRALVPKLRNSSWKDCSLLGER